LSESVDPSASRSSRAKCGSAQRICFHAASLPLRGIAPARSLFILTNRSLQPPTGGARLGSLQAHRSPFLFFRQSCLGGKARCALAKLAPSGACAPGGPTG